jgi:hypothetical protein
MSFSVIPAKAGIQCFQASFRCSASEPVGGRSAPSRGAERPVLGFPPERGKEGKTGDLFQQTFRSFRKTQVLLDVSCEPIIDFSMPGDGLFQSSDRVHIQIVLSAVTQ